MKHILCLIGKHLWSTPRPDPINAKYTVKHCMRHNCRAEIRYSQSIFAGEK